jgi:hypothetical protein
VGPEVRRQQPAVAKGATARGSARSRRQVRVAPVVPPLEPAWRSEAGARERRVPSLALCSKRYDSRNVSAGDQHRRSIRPRRHVAFLCSSTEETRQTIICRLTTPPGTNGSPFAVGTSCQGRTACRPDERLDRSGNFGLGTDGRRGGSTANPGPFQVGRRGPDPECDNSLTPPGPLVYHGWFSAGRLAGTSRRPSRIPEAPQSPQRFCGGDVNDNGRDV